MSYATFTCRGIAVVALATFLFGCVDEDRILTAHCEGASDAFASATFLPADADATIGGVNARQDALGSVFQLARDQGGNSGMQWSHAHTVVANAVTVSHGWIWNGPSIGVRVKLDLDGEALDEESRGSIEPVLLSGSAVGAWDFEREAIDDVFRDLNEDPGVRSILEGAAPQDRYLVITARLLAKFTGVFYTPGGGIWLPEGQGTVSTPFITPWTFRIGNTNFHSIYSCGAIDRLNSLALLQTRVPAVYFYTAVRYDPAMGKVVRDQRIFDVDLLTTVL